jgi:hypothetical protein
MTANALKQLTKMLAVLDGMSQSTDRMLASVNHVEDAAIDFEETISQTELSQSINVSIATIIKWRQLGLIPFTERGHRLFYNRSAVIKTLRLRNSKYDHLAY